MLEDTVLTQKDTANIGVTPSNGGTIPRYMLFVDDNTFSTPFAA